MSIVVGLAIAWLMLVISPLLVYFLGSHGAGLTVLMGVLATALIRSDGQGLLALWHFLPTIFWHNSVDRPTTIEKLVRWSHIFRKDGALALEQEIALESDDYLLVGLQALVDGNSVVDTKRAMEVLRHTRKRNSYEFYQILSFMAQSARWLGLCVALVLFLSLMQREDILMLGVSAWLPMFAAIVYGLGLSVLFLSPLAERIKMQAEQRLEFEVMVADGILAILNNENTRVMAHRLHTYSE